VPLVTRIIIEQLTAAHALHAASKSGSPTEGLEQPKSIGYGIGVAVGLFAMLTAANLAELQNSQHCAVAGFMLRCAVSSSSSLMPQHTAANRMIAYRFDL
jgi:ATP-binding cassette subfamily C (CFTR/MRP) protein 1